MDEKIRQRINELIREEISTVPYDARWPELFQSEVVFLQSKLPSELINRIEHFGSTAVPFLSAKPIIDMLVEVASLVVTKEKIVPILLGEGYEYFWRPAFGDDGPPFYAWFIKRNSVGQRTHHIHMVETDSELWDRLYFRDYLREFPDIAKEYEMLKMRLSELYPHDRMKYTDEKSEFIVYYTKAAKTFYSERVLVADKDEST